MRRAFLRILEALITLAVLVTAGWGLVHLLPGDAVTAMYASADVAPDAEAFEAAAELRIPGLLEHLANVLTLNWGMSFEGGLPVADLVADALPYTLGLAGAAGVASTLAGLVLGVESARRRGTRTDRLLAAVAGALQGVPDMAAGILLLLVFALGLGWLPAAGASTAYAELDGWGHVVDFLRHLALPWLTLLLTQLPQTFLVVRGVMLETFDSPFMLTAAAKGVDERRRARVHAARMALLPVLTRFAARGALMLTGLIVVESIFSYPGLGSLLTQAVAMRDAPLVLGVCTTAAAAVVLAGLAIDLFCMMLAPAAGRDR